MIYNWTVVQAKKLQKVNSPRATTCISPNLLERKPRRSAGIFIFSLSSVTNFNFTTLLYVIVLLLFLRTILKNLDYESGFWRRFKIEIYNLWKYGYSARHTRVKIVINFGEILKIKYTILTVYNKFSKFLLNQSRWFYIIIKDMHFDWLYITWLPIKVVHLEICIF